MPKPYMPPADPLGPSNPGIPGRGIPGAGGPRLAPKLGGPMGAPMGGPPVSGPGAEIGGITGGLNVNGNPGTGLPPPMSGTPPFMKPARGPGGFAHALQNDFSGMDSGSGESGLPWEPQAQGGLPLGMGGPMSGGLPLGMGGPMSGAPGGLPLGMGGPMSGIAGGEKPGGVGDMMMHNVPMGSVPGGAAPAPASPQRQQLAQLLANPAMRGGRTV